jgi:pilus assembly protein CpaB
MGRTTRFLVVLLVAVVVASLAAYAVYVAIQRMPARQASAETTPIVVAARPIALGTLLTPDDVKVVDWPVKAPVQGGFDNVDKVVDRGAIRAMSENEPVTESRLAAKGMGAGLPPTIPAGMRAISVRVNDVIGVAGFVVPGSFVDVVVTVRGGSEAADTMSRVVVSNVQVLTSGTRYDQDQAQKDGKPIQTSVVTLLVTPADAERIALAGNEGKITLTLRNPLDQVQSGTTGVKMASLMGAPDAQPVAPSVPTRPVVRAPLPAPVTPPAPKPYTVEAIRGAKRTEEVIR